ncbi:MAG TPA: HD domain-containing protein [Spirochaetota bacterium]|nr:MAG: deoxyguanosinetriphosphate triphosphohydrolase-like protein [Spirochaetes bacterium ADurb.BinA120]HNU92654.1 HD domain-containing protein [Spirochaetota bacterium]HPV98991.1 HD domain-containing protein [Spirochaetota bacterium]
MTYEIRDPIHGFIVIGEIERDIINHTEFQRLRRIRQLGFTDMVYPGAMHTRFEHSLGVMHVATKMFEHIIHRRPDYLKDELGFTDSDLERDKRTVRLAALLHDIGHAPFSHATEELMSFDEKTKKVYKHENYSAAIVRYRFGEFINSNPQLTGMGINADYIADFLDGSTELGKSLLWRNLIAGQLDADRADYLLRDSHHIGVAYGHYDLNRILHTLSVATDGDTSSPQVVVMESGRHAAEALILARYMMFTQVYFQHTRRVYDHHIARSIKTLLKQKTGSADTIKNGKFPPPTEECIQEYLDWDDSKVMGLVKGGDAGEHGRILLTRKHYRKVFETPERPEQSDLEDLEMAKQKLSGFTIIVDKAENSWYKYDASDIRIISENYGNTDKLAPLSFLSPVVKGLSAVNQTRLYVPPEKKDDAKRLLMSMNK